MLLYYKQGETSYYSESAICFLVFKLGLTSFQTFHKKNPESPVPRPLKNIWTLVQSATPTLHHKHQTEGLEVHYIKLTPHTCVLAAAILSHSVGEYLLTNT